MSSTYKSLKGKFRKVQIGEVFGQLLVQEDTGERHPKTKEVIWKCLCSGCKGYTRLLTSQLNRGNRKTCGCKIFKKEHANSKYGGGFSPTIVEKYIDKRDKREMPKELPEHYSIIYSVLKGYAEGKSVEELSEQYKITKSSMYKFISQFRMKFNQTYELNYLASQHNVNTDPTKIDLVLRTKFTEDELTDLVSTSDSTSLTNEEMLYATLIVKTGSNDTALKESGFIEALKIKDGPRKKLLGIYLREKPNIQAYIQHLQREQLEALAVNKDVVQTELLGQINQLKEIVQTDDSSPAQRGHLLNAIHMLGKTIGAFQDNIKVTEVDPAKSLGSIIEAVETTTTYSVEELEAYDAAESKDV